MKIPRKLSVQFPTKEVNKPNQTGRSNLLKQRKMFRHASVSGVPCTVKLDTLGSNLELKPVARACRPHLHWLLPAGRSGSEHNSIYNQKLVPGLNLTQGVYTNTAAGGITVTVWLPPAGKGPPAVPVCVHCQRRRITHRSSALGTAFYLELLKWHESSRLLSSRLLI